MFARLPPFPPARPFTVVPYARILLSFVFHAGGYPSKRHARARASEQVRYAAESRMRMRFYGGSGGSENTAGPPITYSRQTRPLNLSKSRFTRADAESPARSPLVCTDARTRVHINIYIHTRCAVRVPRLSHRKRSLSLSLSLFPSRSSLYLTRVPLSRTLSRRTRVYSISPWKSK